jgi:hypothetical protein
MTAAAGGVKAGLAVPRLDNRDSARAVSSFAPDLARGIVVA